MCLFSAIGNSSIINNFALVGDESAKVLRRTSYLMATAKQELDLEENSKTP